MSLLINNENKASSMETCLKAYVSGVPCIDLSLAEIWRNDTEKFATKLAVLARYTEGDNLCGNPLGERLKEDALDIFEEFRLHLTQAGVESSEEEEEYVKELNDLLCVTGALVNLLTMKEMTILWPTFRNDALHSSYEKGLIVTLFLYQRIRCLCTRDMRQKDPASTYWDIQSSLSKSVFQIESDVREEMDVISNIVGGVFFKWGQSAYRDYVEGGPTPQGDEEEGMIVVVPPLTQGDMRRVEATSGRKTCSMLLFQAMHALRQVEAGGWNTLHPWTVYVRDEAACGYGGRSSMRLTLKHGVLGYRPPSELLFTNDAAENCFGSALVGVEMDHNILIRAAIQPRDQVYITRREFLRVTGALTLWIASQGYDVIAEMGRLMALHDEYGREQCVRSMCGLPHVCDPKGIAIAGDENNKDTNFALDPTLSGEGPEMCLSIDAAERVVGAYRTGTLAIADLIPCKAMLEAAGFRQVTGHALIVWQALPSLPLVWSRAFSMRRFLLVLFTLLTPDPLSDVPANEGLGFLIDYVDISLGTFYPNTPEPTSEFLRYLPVQPHAQQWALFRDYPGIIASNVRHAMAAVVAQSTDTFALMQLIISALVACQDKELRTTAYTAFRRLLLSVRERERILLLRRLIQDCPFPQMCPLLIDIVKDSVQISWQAYLARGGSFWEPEFFESEVEALVLSKEPLFASPIILDWFAHGPLDALAATNSSKTNPKAKIEPKTELVKDALEAADAASNLCLTLTLMIVNRPTYARTVLVDIATVLSGSSQIRLLRCRQTLEKYNSLQSRLLDMTLQETMEHVDGPHWPIGPKN